MSSSFNKWGPYKAFAILTVNLSSVLMTSFSCNSRQYFPRDGHFGIRCIPSSTFLWHCLLCCKRWFARFKSVDEILECNNSNKSYRTVLSCATVLSFYRLAPCLTRVWDEICMCLLTTNCDNMIFNFVWEVSFWLVLFFFFNYYKHITLHS